MKRKCRIIVDFTLEADNNIFNNHNIKVSNLLHSASKLFFRDDINRFKISSPNTKASICMEKKGE